METLESAIYRMLGWTIPETVEVGGRMIPNRPVHGVRMFNLGHKNHCRLPDGREHTLINDPSMTDHCGTILNPCVWISRPKNYAIMPLDTMSHKAVQWLAACDTPLEPGHTIVLRNGDKGIYLGHGFNIMAGLYHDVIVAIEGDYIYDFPRSQWGNQPIITEFSGQSDVVHHGMSKDTISLPAFVNRPVTMRDFSYTVYEHSKMPYDELAIAFKSDHWKHRGKMVKGDLSLGYHPVCDLTLVPYADTARNDLVIVFELRP